MIEWTELSELSERSEKQPSAGAGVQGAGVQGAEHPEACILHTIAYYPCWELYSQHVHYSKFMYCQKLGLFSEIYNIRNRKYIL